jgi:hypothetical protein
VGALAEELPESYAAKREAARHGVDLVFSYANPLPVMPSGDMVDYHCESLVTVPPGETLLQVFRREGLYAAHGAPLERLQDEGAAVRRRRWEHVGAAVLGRQDPTWWVD